MRKAFKEWAVVVDALGRGEQIIILRKGGISEGKTGFKPEHTHFFLFPTRFHQQREQVIPAAQARYDVIAPKFPTAEEVRLEFFAEIAAVEHLHSLDDAAALHSQHIWRDEVITERFDWGRDQAIYALVVKVFKLPAVIEIPLLPEYGGCKSWIDLQHDYDVTAGIPVLDCARFEEKLGQFLSALKQSQSARRLTKTAPADSAS